jgi:hypothetical protein
VLKMKNKWLLVFLLILTFIIMTAYAKTIDRPIGRGGATGMKVVDLKKGDSGGGDRQFEPNNENVGQEPASPGGQKEVCPNIGVVGVSLVDVKEILTDGKILQLTFEVKGAEGTSSPLKLIVRSIKNVAYMIKNGVITVLSSVGKAPLPALVAIAAIGLASRVIAGWRRY